MPVRQALNAVYARIVGRLEGKQRTEFIDELYGFDEMNRAGNDVLRDIRDVDESMADMLGGDE
jgi:hypothetical protein